MNAAIFAQDPNPAPNAGKVDPRDAIKSESLWLTVGLLTLVLVVGAIVLTVVDRWRKRAALPSSGSIEEVTRFREMYESGEITRSEYETIRNRMSGRPVVAPTEPADPGGPSGPSEANASGPPDVTPR